MRGVFVVVFSLFCAKALRQEGLGSLREQRREGWEGMLGKGGACQRSWGAIDRICGGSMEAQLVCGLETPAVGAMGSAVFRRPGGRGGLLGDCCCFQGR